VSFDQGSFENKEAEICAAFKRKDEDIEALKLEVNKLQDELFQAKKKYRDLDNYISGCLV
jgi:hypothetical protein